MEATEVSIIIPCYRSHRTLGFTLRSILAQQTDLSYEIIVVDSSPHPVESWLKSRFPRVKIHRSAERLLPGAARNRGVEQSKAPYLAFLDADTIADDNWLSLLYRRLLEDDTIKVIGGAVGNANPDRIPARVLYWIEFSEFMRYSKRGRRPFLSSSNLFLRREDFLQSGGFQERYAMSEDLLFSQHFRTQLFLETGTGVDHLHRSRWLSVKQHLQQLGFWSGYARQEFRLPGSSLQAWPSLGLLLPFYRLCAIVARGFQTDFREGCAISIHLPILFVGLIHWTHGFRRGLRQKPSQNAD